MRTASAPRTIPISHRCRRMIASCETRSTSGIPRTRSELSMTMFGSSIRRYQPYRMSTGLKMYGMVSVDINERQLRRE